MRECLRGSESLGGVHHEQLLDDVLGIVRDGNRGREAVVALSNFLKHVVLVLFPEWRKAIQPDRGGCVSIEEKKKKTKDEVNTYKMYKITPTLHISTVFP